MIANSGLKRTRETERRKSMPGGGQRVPKPRGELCEEVWEQMAEAWEERVQSAHSEGGRRRVKTHSNFIDRA